jgi:hypothetical protein
MRSFDFNNSIQISSLGWNRTIRPPFQQSHGLVGNSLQKNLREEFVPFADGMVNRFCPVGNIVHGQLQANTTRHSRLEG